MHARLIDVARARADLCGSLDQDYGKSQRIEQQRESRTEKTAAYYCKIVLLGHRCPNEFRIVMCESSAGLVGGTLARRRKHRQLVYQETGARVGERSDDDAIELSHSENVDQQVLESQYGREEYAVRDDECSELSRGQRARPKREERVEDIAAAKGNDVACTCIERIVDSKILKPNHDSNPERSIE